MISVVAAVAKNGVIGKQGGLPWYIPEDLKRFRQLTTGKTVLMGRKTFDSIMKRNGKPLPNRKNVVITRDPNFQAGDGVVVYTDLNKAILELRNEGLYVLGGGQIYEQTLPLADSLYITHVDQEIEGDVYFPEISPQNWRKTREEKHEGFSFAIYIKLSPSNGKNSSGA